MRKVNSIIVSSIIALSAVMPLSTSAVSDEKENFNVRSETLFADLELEDGTVIPKGNIALTVALNNSTSLKSSATRLCIDNANVVVDEKGVPIVEKGELLDDSIISSAMKDNTVVVSSASAVQESGSGELFTIFVNDTPSNITVFDISNESVRSESTNNRGSLYWYRIGDVNDSGSINSSDASDVLAAIYAKCGNINGTLTLAEANSNMSLYFPNTHYAEAADTDMNNNIKKKDAENTLDFYSYLAVGYTPSQAQAVVILEGNHCNEQVLVIEP